jgi:hypothetical protein
MFGIPDSIFPTARPGGGRKQQRPHHCATAGFQKRDDVLEEVDVACCPSGPGNPVTAQHLLDEGLGAEFAKYLGGWPGFVDSEAPARGCDAE